MTSRRAISHLVAAVLLMLIGLAVAVALMFPVPVAAQDIIASEDTQRTVSIGMLCIGAFLVLSGILLIHRTRSDRYIGTIALLLFVVFGFIFNVMIFGSTRPLHSGTNVVVGAVVVWLLWREKSVAQ